MVDENQAGSARLEPHEEGENSASEVLHTLDRYRMERELGAGSMAKVMLAYDPKRDRKVAIKIPKRQAKGNTETNEKRFLREAQTLIGISHPNICQVHDVGIAPEGLFYTMAFVEGRPLDKILLDRTRLDEWQAAYIIRKVASGIEACHQAGVLHRDLKPANILIDREGEPIVLDFGLTRFHDENQDAQTQLTVEGETVGTPMYMSPEQVRGKRDLSPATDVYSLGVVLWEMLCGVPPFLASDLMSMMKKIVDGPCPSPRTQRPDISDELETICLRAMATKAEDRYRSMGEFGAALDQFLEAFDLEEAKGSIQNMGSVSSGAGYQEVSKERLMWTFGVIGVLIVVAIIAKNLL